MSETESRLLSLIVAEWIRVLMLDEKEQPGERWLDFQDRIAPLKNLKRFGIAVNPDWLGRRPSDRQARSRGLIELERSGWIVRTSLRPSFIQMTDFGMRSILEGLSSRASSKAKPPAPEPLPTPIELAGTEPMQ